MFSNVLYWILKLSGRYMKLSKNLSYEEVVRSETAKRHGINNDPSPRQLEVIKNLAVNLIQPVRDYFGVKIYVSSVYRSPELNAKVGGAASSDHMVLSDVAAIDIDQDVYESATGVSNADIFYFIYDNLDYNKLIWEFGDKKKPDWVHVSFSTDKKKNERKNTYRAVRDSKGRVSYTTFNDLR